MAKKHTAIPFDAYAEESVVGTIIENPEALSHASQVLAAEEFWQEELVTIFRVCIGLRDKGIDVNRQSIINTLQQEKELQEVGGEEYIAKLLKSADGVTFSSNVSKVKSQAILREVAALANKILKDISTNSTDASSLIQETKATLSDFEQRMRSLPPRIVGLEIATTNPRSYKVKFSNGNDVSIGIDDLMSVRRVKQIIINQLDFVPALPRDWEKFLRSLMEAAPKRAVTGVDLTEDILEVIRDLFEARGEAQAASDLRTGAYATYRIGGKNYYLFQKRAVVEYIKQQVRKDMDTVQLWRIIQQWGAIDNQGGKPLCKRIGNDVRHGLWGLPALLIDAVDEVEETIEEVDTSFLD